jgi:predicted transcriptional regulator of viral defense system
VPSRTRFDRIAKELVLRQVAAVLQSAGGGFSTPEFERLVGPAMLAQCPDLLARLERAGLVCQVSRASGYWTVAGRPEAPAAVARYERWFDGYMRHRQAAYYVGLSSAALWHVSAAATTGRVYVVVDTHHAALRSGTVTMEFCRRRNACSVPCDAGLSQRVGIRISTAEATLVDSASYVTRIGGIDRLVGIVGALHDRCEWAGIERALAMADRSACAQRLGYALETTGADRLAAGVEQWLRARRFDAIPLDPSVRLPAQSRAARWRLHVNVTPAGTGAGARSCHAAVISRQ